MSNKFRIDYNIRLGVWFIHRWNPIAEFWTYVHSEPTKALAIAWTEKQSY